MRSGGDELINTNRKKIEVFMFFLNQTAKNRRYRVKILLSL